MLDIVADFIKEYHIVKVGIALFVVPIMFKIVFLDILGKWITKKPDKFIK